MQAPLEANNAGSEVLGSMIKEERSLCPSQEASNHIDAQAIDCLLDKGADIFGVDKNRQRNIEIFKRRVIDGETLQDIADSYAISRERVRQIVRGIKIEVRVLVSGRWKALPALGGAKDKDSSSSAMEALGPRYALADDITEEDLGKIKTAIEGLAREGRMYSEDLPSRVLSQVKEIIQGVDSRYRGILLAVLNQEEAVRIKLVEQGSFERIKKPALVELGLIDLGESGV